MLQGGEEAENGSATAGSPSEEKSAVSSPTAENEAAAPVAAAPTPSTETKEESAASATSSPAEDKTEEPTPSAPTPVPVEEKKEEVEKVEAEKKVVEVSPAGGQFVPDPVEVSVFRVQTVATPSSIIERKTKRNDPSTPAAESLDATTSSTQRPPSSSFVDEQQQQQQQSSPPTESTLVPSSVVEALPVVDTDASLDNPADEATKTLVESLNDTATDNTAEVDALPPLESDAKSLSGVPVDRLESPSSESSVNRKLVTEATTPLSEQESNKVEESTREHEVDENVERFPEEPSQETTQVVEQPLQLSDEIGNLEGARSIENETSEVVVLENCCSPVVQEDFVACEREKIPESASTKERDEESVEEVAGSNEILREEETERAEEAAVIDPPVLTVDAIVESEEGPVPISEEILVLAKPAIVIPVDEEEEEEEEVTETVEEVANAGDACISRVVDAGTVPVIPDVVEDKLETETENDVVVPTEEILISEVSEKSEDPFVPNETTIDPASPVSDLAIENVADRAADVPEMTRNEEESMPPPLPESPISLTSQEKFYSESVIIADDSNAVPSPVVHVEPQILDVKEVVLDTQEVDGSPLSLPPRQEIEETSECFIADIPVPQVDNDASLKISDSPTCCPVNEKATYLPSETQTNSSSSRYSGLMDDLPPAPDDAIQQSDSFKYPLPPPEELSCSFSTSEANNSELPAPDENASSNLRNPTETLPIPPRSPSPLSNVSITSNLATPSTKDSSQTLLYDDQSNREFKMESVSISLNSYNESDIELKERLAESLAETEEQEESSVSCQLSNNATSSTTIQEIHQSTPEPEVPVENNLARDSTTESSADAIKVTTPAVPSEIPASPPSAPAITEDVASVAKAIEEIDISDKAVAAATIECNTNEIIAEAHYQNNINE
ncbi:hypothetical protein K0M31_004945 [Melipona bicolor]|uniref:Uncharacterized protein n=1 Tax=Melipona bicolor TaxID=60889 RepID=A0AA40FVT9_9HYME|nr:hypothetical protein K0M31_004945 [Melipona bicolor]